MIGNNVKYSDLHKCISTVDSDIMKDIRLIDVYSGKNIAEGFVSYTISIKFQDEKNTLRDEQVDKVVEDILKILSDELKVGIRQ